MSEPVRTCVGCRQRGPQADLVRVVASGGAVLPDPGRRLPGRGAYLHASLDCLQLAQRRRAFGRALRVTGPLDATAVREVLEV